MPSGELHLFSYQHFVTASLKRSEAGTETLHIAFSDHELQIEGQGLRDLLLGLQDFAVKWLRAAPGRYLPARADGVITAIQIVAAVDAT
jgi:hypothetical protein